MQFYTISELENLANKEINNILIGRSELCASLVKNALIEKEIKSNMGKAVSNSTKAVTFNISNINYHKENNVSFDEKFTIIPINIYLDGYACKTKKDTMYYDEQAQHAVRYLLEQYVEKDSRIQWGDKKLQGLDFINLDFLLPTQLINPDILAFDAYSAYLKENKNATPLSKEKKKIELEKKLISDIEELKYQRFNLLNEHHLYVPEDKEELMKFIQKASKITFDKEALIGVVKKHSDNEEIISEVLTGFHEDVFQYASNRLKNDRQFIESCLARKVVNILEFVGEEFRDDDTLMSQAINMNGYIIRVASDRLKNNKNLCLAAVGNGGYAYGHISEEMKKDKDIILKLVETRGDFFAVCPEVKTNKELLIKAFSTAFEQRSHHLLERTSEKLKNDKEVALAALKCNPNNIKYIGDKLRAEIGDFEPYTYLSKIDLYNEISDGVANNTGSAKRKIKM